MSYGSTSNLVSASRGIFTKLLSTSAESDITEVNTLRTKRAHVGSFTNVPFLPTAPTQKTHIINKEFAEGLMRVIVTTIAVVVPPLRTEIMPTSKLNDIFVLTEPGSYTSTYATVTLLYASPDFCRFRLINSTAVPVHTFPAGGAGRIYNSVLNPSGVPPLIVNGKTQIEFTRIGTDWYTVIS